MRLGPLTAPLWSEGRARSLPCADIAAMLLLAIAD
jgi:hypothetical protein